MRNRADVADVAKHFAEYLNRVEVGGERFVLMRGERPVAELRPVSPRPSLRELPAMLAALPRLSPEEAAGYGEEIASARAELSSLPFGHSGDDLRFLPA